MPDHRHRWTNTGRRPNDESPACGNAVRRMGSAWHRPRACAIPGLSQQAYQDGRTLPARRLGGRAGARHRGPARRRAWSERRDREPRRRRRRQQRREDGRGRRPRRLHRPHHPRRSADDRPGRVQEHRLRSGQGVCAGRAAGRDAADHFRAPEPAGEISGRGRGLRQGQSGQDFVGLARLRHLAAPVRSNCSSSTPASTSCTCPIAGRRRCSPPRLPARSRSSATR